MGVNKITVEYIDHMGSDLTVAQTARVSFAKTSEVFTTRAEKAKGSDEGIIEYLAKHNHWTPFAHPQVMLRVAAPVPIRTQCFKSKVGFVENEESRRYISSEPELFVPDHFRGKPEGSIKQGSEGVHPRSQYWVDKYLYTCNTAIEAYLDMVDDGVAPEQARFVLPQGVKVNWIWTGSLSAYARFCGLRLDPHAQAEVREVANEVSNVIEPLFPYCWKALLGSP